MPGVISHRGAALPPFNDAQKYRFLPWDVLPRGLKIYICMLNPKPMAVQHTYPAAVPGGAVCGAYVLRPYAGYTHHIKIRIGYVNSPNVSLPNPGRLREPAAASGRGDFATFATIMRRQSTMTLRFVQPLTPHTSFDATR